MEIRLDNVAKRYKGQLCAERLQRHAGRGCFRAAGRKQSRKDDAHQHPRGHQRAGRPEAAGVGGPGVRGRLPPVSDGRPHPDHQAGERRSSSGRRRGLRSWQITKSADVAAMARMAHQKVEVMEATRPPRLVRREQPPGPCRSWAVDRIFDEPLATMLPVLH